MGDFFEVLQLFLMSLKWPLIILQVVLSPLLILFVLLQAGKGDDIGSAFSGGGGGSSSVLGTGGASKVLVQGTVILVTIFMLNSVALAWIFKRVASSDVGTKVSEPLVPAPATGSGTEPNNQNQNAAVPPAASAAPSANPKAATSPKAVASPKPAMNAASPAASPAKP